METAILLQIDEIRKRMKCSKDFQCAASGFNKLCRAKDIGLSRHLLCLEYAPSLCDFSLLLDKEYYCACPLRVFLAKKMKQDTASKTKALEAS